MVVVLDRTKLKIQINGALGFIKNDGSEHYYFGMNLPYEVTKKKRVGKVEVEITEIEEGLVIVTDNKRLIVLSEETKYKVDGRPNMKNKWEMESIQLYIDGRDATKAELLFNMIRGKYEFYMDFDNEPRWYAFHALWDMGTYFYTLFDAYPYVLWHGTKDSGKTKGMTLSTMINFNGMRWSNTNATNIFRAIKNNMGCLGFDDLERITKSKRPDSEDIIELLNNGYKKGTPVPRMNKELTTQELFDVYCPKQIANIVGLDSISSLKSRSIQHIMISAKEKDVRASREPNERYDGDFVEIRNELYIFALSDWKKVLEIYDELRESEIEFGNREKELVLPILTMAKLVSDDVYKEMTELLKNNFVEEEDEDWDRELIILLKDKITSDEWVSIKDITQWMSLVVDGQNKPSAKWIGRCIKKMGFNKKKRIGHNRQVFINVKRIDDMIMRLRIDRGRVEPSSVAQSSVSAFSKQDSDPHNGAAPNNDYCHIKKEEPGYHYIIGERSKRSFEEDNKGLILSKFEAPSKIEGTTEQTEQKATPPKLPDVEQIWINRLIESIDSTRGNIHKMQEYLKSVYDSALIFKYLEEGRKRGFWIEHSEGWWRVESEGYKATEIPEESI